MFNIYVAGDTYKLNSPNVREVITNFPADSQYVCASQRIAVTAESVGMKNVTYLTANQKSDGIYTRTSYARYAWFKHNANAAILLPTTPYELIDPLFYIRNLVCDSRFATQFPLVLVLPTSMLPYNIPIKTKRLVTLVLAEDR